MFTRHSRSDCPICIHSAEHGWSGVSHSHCSGCGRDWAGLREAHCSSCHLHFSGDTVFDRHRKDGHCLSVRSMRRDGLRLVDSKYGKIWRTEKRPHPFG